MRTATKKSGFTLVELLVVIAIIGTLMGLLLPAVQSAREAGRRNTCNSNLRQMGIAVTKYDGQMGRLPGWRNSHPNNNNPTDKVGWTVPLLPNLERQDLYNKWETLGHVPGEKIPPAATVAMPILQCPTSPPENNTGGFIAYAGNAGTTLYQNNPNHSNDLYKKKYGQQFYDGVLCDRVGGGAWQPAQMNLDVVSNGDGAATTLLFAERNAITFVQGQWSNLVLPEPPVSNPLLSFSNSVAAFGWDGADGLPINNESSNASPSSNHSGGAMFLFCGGNTRFISDSCVAGVYKQLLTPRSEFLSLDSDFPTKAIGSLDVLNEGNIP